MTRRDTIIVAILVNASLLTILFITALTSHEEELIPSQPQFAAPAERVIRPKKEVPNLVIPEQKQVAITSKEALKKEMPVVHKLPEAALVKKEPEKKPEPKKPVTQHYAECIVKKGDNLEKIAKRYQTTVSEIKQVNQLPNTFLRIGQVLRVPQDTKIATLKKEAKKAPSEYYVVKVGDNPWTIAMKHHIKVKDLLRLNQLDDKKARRIKPGDRLRIR